MIWRTAIATVIAAASLFVGAGSGAAFDDYEVERLAGTDRIATAVAISRRGFPSPTSAEAAVLSRADDFADALAGAPLAIHRRGPLLLTDRSALDPRTRAELQRVARPGATVFLLGGSQALDPSIEGEIVEIGLVPRRIAGRDRYETAVAIAEADGSRETVLIATGRNFPDGIVAGAAAGAWDGSVVFSDDERLPESTARYVEHTRIVFAVGSQAAAAAPDATPLFGATRYETATAVADRFFGGDGEPDQIGVATGLNFPDALAGSALVAFGRGGPLLLTHPDDLPDDAHRYIEEHALAADEVFIFGDHGVVSQAVEDEIELIFYGYGP